ncbi:MAG: uracil-DNA glycosylase, partial [Xanthobacteraceae bacterium]|nr:uracil-DNA glycosylase [Xanthobacteraceae bacterium]
MMSDRPPTARELLAFYLEAGVDCALADSPLDRLAEAAAEDRAPPLAPTAAPGRSPLAAPVVRTTAQPAGPARAD